jgi:hypothetical protein
MGRELGVWKDFFGAKLMILRHPGLGQAILEADSWHINRHLQGHRTYFLPAGARTIDVASLH